MAEVINACCLCIIKKLLEWNFFKLFITRCQWWAGQGMLRALVWTGSQLAPPVRTRPRSVRSSLWSCSRQPSCSCHQRSFFHLQHSNVSEEGVLQMHFFQIKMAWCKTGFFGDFMEVYWGSCLRRLEFFADSLSYFGHNLQLFLIIKTFLQKSLWIEQKTIRNHTFCLNIKCLLIEMT